MGALDATGAYRWSRTWGHYDHARAGQVAVDTEQIIHTPIELSEDVDINPDHPNEFVPASGDFDITLQETRPSDGLW
ncbi:hypothetical protein SAMN02745121_06327 [Nannocystis exedens]|uniref:Uncharacterized protein n=2 Tax=Nannocystis exedens TaxID=54 RepID=A0A1I2EZ32_9BACT|nr:hypothetical protein NAEX_02542 [Nannocystis exedens]SFE97716.1 hypothetical protein SAMN02745121_06327 [Nannocystis exedens]